MMPPICSFVTPLGTIRLVSGAHGLTRLSWSGGGPDTEEPIDPELLLGKEEVRQYFYGRLQTFTVKVDPSCWQGFAAEVIAALRTVPYGETITYGDLASLAGHPGAARAVGGVMANNPLPIILPCHRVIAANGAMTGYSGGDGIATKIYLLNHEKTA
jgi:methylated-DNA-[protein]-cysteine S-methyltransferase